MSDMWFSEVAEAVGLVLRGSVRRVDGNFFKVYRIPSGHVRIDVDPVKLTARLQGEV